MQQYCATRSQKVARSIKAQHPHGHSGSPWISSVVSSNRRIIPDKRPGGARLFRFSDFSLGDCFVEIAVIRGLTISGVKIPASAAF
jgi:hypothetical protein